MMDGPLILPKGVVKNSSTIYSSLEKFKSEPLSVGEIAELWKVYTTTKRRLLDPTAERLENYWWRIWGSRSRHLKAAIVVQIFAEISEGQSFVPLTSQANRDEGTPPTNYRPLPRGASSTTAIHRSSTSKPGTTPKQTAPPPSILKGSDSTKKARNPSASGPKPTARFISPNISPHVSPHDSENEVLVSPRTQVIVHPPSPIFQEVKSEKRLTVPTGKKKFVAGRGKRPVVVRRQSSQSSTDGSARAAEVQVQSSADRTPPQFPDHTRELARQRGQISSQENSSSSSGRTERKTQMSSKNTKLSETKLSSPPKTVLGTRKPSREVTVNAEAGPSEPVVENQHPTTADVASEQLDQLEMQRLLLAESNARALGNRRSLSHANITSAPRQHTTETRKSSDGAARPLQMHSKSAVSLAPNFATAIGHNSEEGSPPSPRSVGKGKGRATTSRPHDDIFNKIPVQPISPTSVPHSFGGLSRSKSQLTLLLEMDRAKTNDKLSSSNEVKGKNRGS